LTPIIRRAAFWLLLPLTALQGLWLRRRALRLPPAPGEKRGNSGSGPALSLLAIGDSIIAGAGMPLREESLPVKFAQALSVQLPARLHWLVEGENGVNISGLIEKLDALDTSEQADLILISIGVNDVTGLSRSHHWKAQLEKLIRRIRQRWPQAVVVFAGLPPMSKFPLPPQPLRFSLGMRATTLDDIAAGLISRQENMLHIPTLIDPGQHSFCEDGFHPSPESVVVWAEELALRITPLLRLSLAGDEGGT
jgi:lysophospholipase L1-like esterase